MTTKNRRQLAQDLALTLGIDLSAENVTGFNVRARAGEPVTVTVIHHLKDTPGIGVKQFTLQPMDLLPRLEPYDVNWACMTAQLRLEAFIDQRADFHKQKLVESSHKRRRKDLLHDIFGNDLSPFLVGFLSGAAGGAASASGQARSAGEPE
jgi:hypothetical protein